MVTTANQTPPHPGTTPSPVGLGKGMSSQERAAQNAPRSSSMSSQMAAITAALDRDNSPSPSGMNSNKGKLDMIKDEPKSAINVKMECGGGDQDEGNDAGGHSGLGGHTGTGAGKNVNNDMTSASQMKIEIKQEPMDEAGGEAGASGSGIVKVRVELDFSPGSG